MALGGADIHVYAPHPSFSMYRLISMAMGQDFSAISLEEGFRLPTDSGFFRELSDPVKKVFFIPSPYLYNIFL